MIDQGWIVSIQNEKLTFFFKLFPYLVSDYFYVACIGIGYWKKRDSLLFRSLAFLIPFSILINCMLKNLIRIARPDSVFHLIRVHDPFGFPSGDVQVATVFWVMMYLFYANKKNLFLWLMPVVGVGVSRIYLGVHSVADVIAGFLVGLLIIHVWKTYGERMIFSSSTFYSYLFLFLFTFIPLIFYIRISHDISWPPMVPLALGFLVGFIISFPLLNKAPLYPVFTYFHLTLSLGIMFIIIKYIPVASSSSLSFTITTIMKSAFISFVGLGMIPFIPLVLEKIRFIFSKKLS
jgi:hypothetical protein